MTETNEDKKRVTCKRPHPNQRVHEFLNFLCYKGEQAQSQYVPVLKLAISSLERYPLPISSGAECAILKGFDKKLCDLIDKYIHKPFTIKKTKLQDPHHEVEVISETKTGSTPKINCRKDKQQNKCEEQFEEPCTNQAAGTADTVMQGDNGNGSHEKSTPNNNREKNNNTARFNCRDESCSGFAVPTVDLANLINSLAGNGPPHTVKEVIPEDVVGDSWEYFKKHSSKEQKKIYDENISKCYNNVPVINLVEDSSSESSLSNATSDDESNSQCTVLHQADTYFQPIGDVQQPTSDAHEAAVADQPSSVPQQADNLQEPIDCQVLNKNRPQSTSNIPPRTNSCNSGICYNFKDCKHCKSIATAAEAFEVYFKKKLIKDAEEFQKYVMPHKLYKPAYRCGAYAILVALLEQRIECPYRECLSKDELIQKAQKHMDQSFTSLIDPNSQASVWVYANRLLKKGMVEISPKMCNNYYKLTVLGRAVASTLVKENTPEVTINDVIFNGLENDRVPIFDQDVILTPPPLQTSVNEDLTSVFIDMPPGTYEIVMLIDKREHIDAKFLSCPNKHSKYELRNLNLGDFLWVARSKKTGQELVLPYIVERKTTDDFCASIKDGRYHEQKFRLRKCGLKTVMYLVENSKKKKSPGLPISTLNQAMNNMCIQDGFTVIKTISVDHSFRFLGMLSQSLVHRFMPKHIRGCNRDTQGKELMTFDFFHKLTCKNQPLTVKDTFVKMLLQLKGLSIEKALAITEKYNSPRALMMAYEQCTEREGELLISRLKFNNFTRHIGPVVSKTIYKMFSKQEI